MMTKQFADAWTTDTRNDGVLFCKLRDGSPQWMTDAIHAAHGDIMPLDWIYEHCSRIVDMMTEYEPEQWDDSVSEWAMGWWTCTTPTACQVARASPGLRWPRRQRNGRAWP
jgi:hypothetical protein